MDVVPVFNNLARAIIDAMNSVKNEKFEDWLNNLDKDLKAKAREYFKNPNSFWG
jgi:hypothetical protein